MGLLIPAAVALLLLAASAVDARNSRPGGTQ